MGGTRVPFPFERDCDLEDARAANLVDQFVMEAMRWTFPLCPIIFLGSFVRLCRRR